jgi:acetyl-CoA acetyltransferase
MSDRTKAAIVGIGTTDYYRHGSATKTNQGLLCEAILTACADAGIDPTEIDGFTGYSEQVPPSTIAPSLGVKELRYSGFVWGGGGGGSCAAIGNAVAAIEAGYANVVVLYHAVRRVEASRVGGAGGLTATASPFTAPYGLGTPVQQFAMIVRRHMHLYGTTSEDFGRLAISQRNHALRNPRSVMKSELTLEDYLSSRMIADPFRLFDCCQENDGGAAIIVTSLERARDLRQAPAEILGVSMGGWGAWGYMLSDQNAPADYYATAGHRLIAKNLYERTGLAADDIDVAQLYDHFTGMVLLQMEDYGFCEPGGSGAFVAAGEASWPNGRIPVNTSGGNLSEVNLHGTTHLIEGVKQIRGTSTSQVENAQVCLVTGGPSPIPSSSMILGRS